MIKNHFHINSFALSLALKVRFFLTRKWPIDSQALFQKRVPGFLQVSKREKTFAAEWFYCFRAFGNLMKPEARVFEMTSPKKQYKIMQCCLFSIFL